MSSLNTGALALRAQGLALQTIGHNIANATTEGFSRQRVELRTTNPQALGDLSVGTGVIATAVRRVVDESLESMIRDARGDLGTLRQQSRALERVEAVVNELSDSDLSDNLGRFFEALEDLAARPEDAAARRQVVEAGEALASGFRAMDDRLRQFRQEQDQAIVLKVSEVNRITSEIADLNRQVLASEEGGIHGGTANDLRDRRDQLAKDLAELAGIRAVETERGALNVLAGNDYLVFGDEAFALTAVPVTDDRVLVSRIEFAVARKTLTPGGELEGMVLGRDDITRRFLDGLNELATSFMQAVNRVHTQGRGQKGHADLLAENAVRRTDVPLDEAGLPFAVEDGSFLLDVRSKATGRVDSFRIEVDVDGIASEPDTTLDALRDRINQAVALAFPGQVEASITTTNRLRVATSSSDLELHFSEDSSGVLAALGLGTFFSGRDASTMAVSGTLRADPSLLAAALSTTPGDNRNAVALAALRGQAVASGGTATVEEALTGLVGRLGIDVQDARQRLENQEVLAQQVLNERESISGVSMDDEALDLVKHQRAFQAAARYVSVVDGLLESLLGIL
ncbi:MAG: flagellar hook-associated protein FlgK [Planctomycetes bacterium]|nr:flagellar hook-associated protein FlgK [Planctomycetota bacterium]